MSAEGCRQSDRQNSMCVAASPDATATKYDAFHYEWREVRGGLRQSFLQVRSAVDKYSTSAGRVVFDVDW